MMAVRIARTMWSALPDCNVDMTAVPIPLGCDDDNLEPFSVVPLAEPPAGATVPLVPFCLSFAALLALVADLDPKSCPSCRSARVMRLVSTPNMCIEGE
jgi:hypothetical protein